MAIPTLRLTQGRVTAIRKGEPLTCAWRVRRRDRPRLYRLYNGMAISHTRLMHQNPHYAGHYHRGDYAQPPRSPGARRVCSAEGLYSSRESVPEDLNPVSRGAASLLSHDSHLSLEAVRSRCVAHRRLDAAGTLLEYTVEILKLLRSVSNIVQKC